MTIVSRAVGLVPVLFVAVLPVWGCGTADPPLDQLELRDALLSDPGVIAGLPQEAQQRLAGRFWAAVALPESTQTLKKSDMNTPEQRLRRLDAQRQQRGQDAFLIGVWGSDAAVETVSPFDRPVRSSPSAPLPPLLGRASTTTQAQEARALAGRAGAAIEDLRNVSGAVQLERVVGWPTAVVAIAGCVYVNATWLTAVAAQEPGDSQNPAQSGALSRNGRVSSLPGRTAGYGGLIALPEDGLAASTHALSAEAVEPDARPTGDPAASGGFGSCSSCSSSSCSSSSCSSSGTPSSCTVNLCSSSADKECCRACALTPERAGPELSMLWMMLWLSVPLLLLTGVDLRSRVRVRLRRSTPRTER